MRVLTRYLLRQLMAPFAYGLTALTGVLLLNQVAKQFGRLVGKGLPWLVILEVFTLSIPFIVAMTLPMAVLCAILYAVGRFAADSEYTACLASGVSPRRLFAPVLGWTVLMVFLTFAFVDQVLPRSNVRLRNLWADIARKKPTLTLREQVVNQLAPSPYYLRASRIDVATGKMRDVTIFDVSGTVVKRVVYADSGLLGVDPNGHDLRLRLWDGKLHQIRATAEREFQVSRFAVNDVRVRDVFDSLQRSKDAIMRSDRELSTCEMLAGRDSADQQRAGAARERRAYARRDLHVLLGLDDIVAPGEGAVPHRLQLPGYCKWWAPHVRDTTAIPADSAHYAAATVGPSPPGAAGQTPTRMARRLSSLAEISAAAEREDDAARRGDRYSVEIHKKFSLGVACLTFALFGAPIALRFPRGGVGLVIGVGLLVYSIYYTGLTGGETLADRGRISPEVAMWSSNALLGLLGLAGMLWVRRSAGLTRGGDLDEILGWLRRLVPRRFLARRREA